MGNRKRMSYFLRDQKEIRKGFSGELKRGHNYSLVGDISISPFVHFIVNLSNQENMEQIKQICARSIVSLLSVKKKGRP